MIMKRLSSFFLFVLCCAFVPQENTPVFKFSDQEFEVGALMTRRSIAFSDNCKTTLKPSRTLDSLAKLLKDHLNLKIEIGVHASRPCLSCKSCSPTQNAADAILKYLVSKGIDTKRLLSKGYGMTSPLIADEFNQPKQDPKSQKVNERVVFKITYNKF
jgi:outer membrane protein OmpA-like peptidoglycan-associated protein